jgi:hypothetical protein
MPIDTISGPFCELLIANYIAHETETAEAPVPIIMEDTGENILPENAFTGIYGFECFEGEEVCCGETTEIKFIDALETIIPYGPVLQAKHGITPTVFVMYYEPGPDGDEENSFFRIGGTLTPIFLDGDPTTQIRINHGGKSTGIVKLQ